LYDEEVDFNLDDMDEYEQWEENIVDAAADVQAYDGPEEQRLLQKQLDDEAPFLRDTMPEGRHIPVIVKHNLRQCRELAQRSPDFFVVFAVVFAAVFSTLRMQSQ
ncbi:hypothetical protein BX616_000113, partial [Lobosporangium transversale]